MSLLNTVCVLSGSKTYLAVPLSTALIDILSNTFVGYCTVVKSLHTRGLGKKTDLKTELANSNQFVLDFLVCLFFRKID